MTHEVAFQECPSDDDNDDEKVKVASRSWKPRLHFVWSYILDWLLPSSDDASSSKGSFEEFFRVVVDGMIDNGIVNDSKLRSYCPRFVVLRQCLSRTQVLGICGFQNGVAPR